MDISGKKYINKQMVPDAEFPTKLGEVLRGRQSKVVFFAADGELDYGKVAEFMDEVRDGGVENLGIAFDDIRAGAAGAAAAPSGP